MDLHQLAVATCSSIFNLDAAYTKCNDFSRRTFDFFGFAAWNAASLPSVMQSCRAVYDRNEQIRRAPQHMAH